MAKEACKHSWKMSDVRYGFLVVEKCFHCNEERSYFTLEHVPPKEEYREGPHFWDYMGSAQSVKFNLRCSDCGETVELDELLGLMTCARCTPDCEANVISHICEPQRVWVYVALCHRPEDSRKILTADKLGVLSKYFNDRIRTPGKKILVVPGWYVKDIDICRGDVLKDVGMFELEPEPETAGS
jgi:hypothetical protein